METPPARKVLAALVGVATLATVGAAAPGVPAGPPFGANRYEGVIEAGGDVDPFQAELVRGERLRISVAAAKKSALLPTLTIEGPGGVVDPVVVVRGRGRRVAVQPFDVGESGPWVVRVAGADGTDGRYRIRFDVDDARAQQLLDGLEAGASVTHRFAAVDGARVQIRVRNRGGGPTLALGGIEAPDGDVDDGQAGAKAAPGETLKPGDVTVARGAGTYGVRIAATGTPGTTARYSLRIRVRPPKRPRGRKVVRLSDLEPRLDVVTVPQDGAAGSVATFTGAALTDGGRVYIGAAEATIRSLTPQSVEVLPPAGTDGEVADIAFVAADGQVAVAESAFRFAPLPEVAGIQDTDAAPVGGAWATGGRSLRVTGTGLQHVEAVLFGALEASPTAAPTSSSVSVTSPAGPSSVVPISLRDRFGRVTQTGVQFTLRTPPVIAAQDPYKVIPSVDRAPGLLRVRGTGFESGDRILLGGRMLPTALDPDGSLAAVALLIPAGAHQVAIRGRFGNQVNGPDLVVGDAPRITALVDDAGEPVRSAELVGGDEVIVAGDGLDASATVRFGQATASVLAADGPGRVRVRVPAVAGPRTVQVTATSSDGQTVAAPFGFEYYDVPVLAPGTGFTTDTPQPPSIGSGEGSDVQAIARWDVVPFQTIDAPFDIGVVAFHMAGIDRVDFSVDDGPWKAASQMRLNRRTGAWEYMARIDPALLADGEFEVRAIVHPTVGEPRVLAGPLEAAAIELGEHSMILHANSGGTLPAPVRWVDAVSGDDTTGDGSEQAPFATPYKALQDIGNCDGAVVYMQPGRYAWGPSAWPYPSADERWATFRPAPGAAPGSVSFDRQGGSGYRIRLVHAQDIAFEDTARFSTVFGERFLWVDGMDLRGPGRDADLSPYTAQFIGLYITDTSFADYENGCIWADIARNVSLKRLSGDAFSNCGLTLNCTADDIDSGSTGNHADVFQLHGTGVRENVIVFGLEATDANCQGLFLADLDAVQDAAFVNVLMARPPGADPLTPPYSQVYEVVNHLVMRGCSFPNQLFAWRHPNIKNVQVLGCVFSQMRAANGSYGQAVVPHDWFEWNHFLDVVTTGTISRGEFATTGYGVLQDVNQGEYTPAEESLLRGRVPYRIAPCDARGRIRLAPDTMGAHR